MAEAHWIAEYKKWKSGLKPFQIQLLDEGAKSQSQAWLLNEMWCEWKSLKENKDKESPVMRSFANRDPWEDLEPDLKEESNYSFELSNL